MFVVVDTNVLVSALWSRNGAPAKIVSRILGGSLIPCYDYRILEEYRAVLCRPKFHFSEGEVNSLLDWFINNGCSVTASECDSEFTDESDRKFYEVALCCNAVLITGNTRHFPQHPAVMSVSRFPDQYPR